MSSHKQVKVRDSDGYQLEVDEGLKKLLKLIWSFEIYTHNSCQENQPGRAWIQFTTAFDASEFLNLVVSYPSDDEVFWQTLYGRIAQYGSEDDWDYKVFAENFGVDETLENDEVITKYDGYNDFVFSVSIRFPVSDISLLEKILMKISKKRKIKKA